MIYPARNKFSAARPPPILSGQINLILIFLFFFVFAVSTAGFFNYKSSFLILGAVSALAAALVTLVNTDFALVILVFSMLLSPEIAISRAVERMIVVRTDDILIITVFFIWLAKMAVNKDLGLLRVTPLNPPLFTFLLVNVISTALGSMSGAVKIKEALFYLLKYTEYAMLYFLVVNNLHTKNQLRAYLIAIFVTAFIVFLYAFPQISAKLRPSAPFEGEHAEPNTLAGYLLVIVSLAMGFFIYTRKFHKAFFLGVMIFLFSVLLLFTLSRSAYLGLIAAFLCFIFVGKRKRFILLTIFFLLTLFIPVIIPRIVKERIINTFSGKGGMIEFKIGRKKIKLEGSAAARFFNWEYAFKYYNRSPIFGYGVTGLGLIDAQYPRILAELGIAGLLAFIWLMARIFKSSVKVYRELGDDDLSKGLALGFICGFIGLLVMGFGASVFVIVRISEPFWFLAGCVMVLPEIAKEEGIQVRNA